MLIDDVIHDFCSHKNINREHVENARSHETWGRSHGSHCSQHKEQYANDKVTIQDLQKLHPPVIDGFHLVDLIAQADPSEYEVLKDLGVLKAITQGLSTQQKMRQGIVPPHYTKQAVCRGCGPVWLFESELKEVLGCPWCFNRGAGLPVPRPR